VVASFVVTCRWEICAPLQVRLVVVPEAVTSPPTYTSTAEEVAVDPDAVGAGDALGSGFGVDGVGDGR
jgi:hypothetical protein